MNRKPLDKSDHSAPSSSVRVPAVALEPLPRDRVTRAMAELPRKLFLPPACAGEPDTQPIPLGGGRWVPPVQVVEMMVRALNLRGTERVLDIGSGSGYQAALLSRLAQEVISVELDEKLAHLAQAAAKQLRLTNLTVRHGDASSGWPERAPYQAIILGAAAHQVPAALIEQLAVGGRLVIPLGDTKQQLVERLQKGIDRVQTETIGFCQLDMLFTPRPTPSSFPWVR